MASLAPPTPTSELPEPTSQVPSTSTSAGQTAPVVESSNLDILSTAAAKLEPELTVVAPETQTEPPAAPGTTAVPNGILAPTEALEAVATASTSSTKSKNDRKRKREVSPVAGVPILSIDNNSQSGPRTRRRVENDASGTNGKGGAGFKAYDPSDGGRPIISCDYCPLHWHMDCLDPPMVAIPARERRWMCPNHIEHLFVSLCLFCLFGTQHGGDC